MLKNKLVKISCIFLLLGITVNVVNAVYYVTGYSWDIDPVYYKDYSGYARVDDAEDDWDNAAINIDIDEGTGLTASIWIYEINFPNDEWYAFTNETTVSGMTLLDVDIKLNEHMMDTLNGDEKQTVIVHEFGHSIGLSENNHLYCVMHQGPSWRIDNDCEVPQIADSNAVNDIYD